MHARNESLARRLRRDVLVLDIDEALGTADRGDRGALDLAYLLVVLLERSDRAHDADRHVLEVRLHVLWPGARGSFCRPAPLQGFAARVLPARARAFRERARGCSLDDHLHVVQRHIRLASGIAAPGLGRVVSGDVPAAHRQVDAAAIRDVIVDDDELLVVRSAYR